ncbi:MAG: aminotransferase class IV, partial [Kocuria sp.]|nr:aminotransferase class IV [Kocuria sp.]
DNAVRGLDLHLDRLRQNSDTVFGRHLPDETILDCLRTGLTAFDADSASMFCFITPTHAKTPLGLDVYVRTAGPASAPDGPLSLDVAGHERYLPDVKHAGEISLARFFARQAASLGFDDTAFEDRDGRLSEATKWNLAFWDGETVTWPHAEYLPGITMQVIRRQLRLRGVAQQTRSIRRADLSDRWSAVSMNSTTPGIPISRIGDVHLAQDESFFEILRSAYAEEESVALV